MEYSLDTVLAVRLSMDLDKTKLLVGHNIEFDINIIGAEFIRQSLKPDFFLSLERLDTGLASVEYCQLKGGIGGRLKMPRLNELYQKLFGKDIEDAHDAAPTMLMQLPDHSLG